MGVVELAFGEEKNDLLCAEGTKVIDHKFLDLFKVKVRGFFKVNSS